MKYYLNQVIDDKNKKLWEELNSELNIVLDLSYEPNWIVNTSGGQITIYIDIEDLKPSNFAHELLHIKIQRNNRNLTRDLKNSLFLIKMNSNFFDNDLVDHFGNALEHFKILPKFIEMGYKNEDFLPNFDKFKMDMNSLRIIEREYRIYGYYKSEFIKYFMAQFFYMKADNNKRNNYSKVYSRLEKIDPELYRLLISFWLGWEKFDYDNSLDKYNKIIEIFAGDIEKWATHKVII